MHINDCIFCQIIAGKIPGDFVYQDRDFIVINDIHPQAPVHMLFIPKKHIKDLTDADIKLVSKLFTLMKKIIGEKHIRDFRFIHNGEGAAYVKHMHVHLLGSVAVDRTL